MKQTACLVAVAWALVCLAPGTGRAQCLGDLNGDNMVTVDELIKAVNRALSGCRDDGICGALSNELAACQAAAKGQPLKTGQTTCSNSNGTVVACTGSGQDGEEQKGLARRYVDNGDGTITDSATGLMWEKLAADLSIHNRKAMYTWEAAFTNKIAMLNQVGFADHNDWRLPNVNELHSLVDYGPTTSGIGSAFDTDCAIPCTITDCSCTDTGHPYWSSTTYQVDPSTAWSIAFEPGGSFGGADPKVGLAYVRAVRGGL